MNLIVKLPASGCLLVYAKVVSMKSRISNSSDNTYEGNAFAGQKQFRFSVVCGFEMTRERLY